MPKSQVSMMISAMNEPNLSVSLRAVLRDLLSGLTPSLRQDEWKRVVDLASEHGVAGFLYKRLHPHVAKSGITPDILRGLQEEYLCNQTRYFQYVSRTTPIFETFTSQAIPFFLYKGFPLIERYYRDPGLRAVVDLDLLVHPRDIPAASAIIEDHGFTKGKGFGHHFYHGELCLDVHQDLFRLDRIPARPFAVIATSSSVWDRLVPYNMQGCPVTTLHPCDEFVFLSWHALKHSFSQLKWMVDLAMMYQELSHSTDFTRHVSRLPDDSVRKAVWYVLCLLHEWFQLPVSSSLLDTLAPQKRGWLECRSFHLLRDRGEMTYFAELSFLGTITGIRPKLQFLRDMLYCEEFDDAGASRERWSAGGRALFRVLRFSPLVFQNLLRVAGR